MNRGNFVTTRSVLIVSRTLKMMMKLIILLIVIVGFAFVHLFEWKFADVAEACERFLGPMGYTGVDAVQILGEGIINRFQYIDLAAVSEYSYAEFFGRAFNGSMTLKSLRKLKDREDLIPSSVAVAMTDNFEIQRGIPGTAYTNITWREPRVHKMAPAFELAYPYGKPQITSSFYLTNPFQGPPSYKNGSVMSPEIGPDNLCTNGWVCEHRWPQIARMVEFHNVVADSPLKNWWDNGRNQIAFSRGELVYYAPREERNAKNDNTYLWKTLKTGLPSREYCNIITGGIVNGKCTGKAVWVSRNGSVFVDISAHAADGVFAIHVVEVILYYLNEQTEAPKIPWFFVS